MSYSGASQAEGLVQRFKDKFAALLLHTPSVIDSHFVLAISGGADSVALLRLLVAAGYQDRLRCVHINHQLQASAEAWGGFCSNLCEQLNIPFQKIDVVVAAPEQKRLGTEAAARNARYAALMIGFSENEILLTAHHADDQLETLLHRLERGTGLLGLQGIKPVSTRQIDGGSFSLIRPLLGFSKEELLSYLREVKQEWIEDPSNTDTQYRRNFYRQTIVPQLSSDFTATLLNVAVLAQETMGKWVLLHEDWCAARKISCENGASLGVQESDFELPALLEFNLQQWLQKQHCSLPKARLSELIRQLKLGSALGHNASYSSLTHVVFVRKREVQVRRLS